MRQKRTKAKAALALLQRGLSVTSVAAALQINRATLYRWRERWPDFRETWEAIEHKQLETAMERGAALVHADKERRARRNAELRPIRQQQAAYARSCKR